MGRLIVIGGGARSGKSRLALDMAHALGEERMFIATAQAYDDEMRERIAEHAAERAGDFTTIEEPIDLAGAMKQTAAADVVVIDCVTLWLSNMLMAERTERHVMAELDRVLASVDATEASVLCVTNEVGMGLVPSTPLGRTFRDCAGRVHQRLAERADEIYAGVIGVMLRIKPGPVEPV